MLCYGGQGRSHGEAQGLVRRKRERRANVSKSFYYGFLRKEWVRQGKQA